MLLFPVKDQSELYPRAWPELPFRVGESCHLPANAEISSWSCLLNCPIITNKLHSKQSSFLEPIPLVNPTKCHASATGCWANMQTTFHPESTPQGGKCCKSPCLYSTTTLKAIYVVSLLGSLRLLVCSCAMAEPQARAACPE